MTHTRPVCLRQFLMVSLARTSSFCCSSPCTFSVALRAQDVDQAGAPDRGRDDLGRERDVVQQIGQLPRGLGVAVFLVEDEPLDGRDRRLHEAPGMSVSEPSPHVVARRSLASSCTVMRRPSVTTVTVPSRSVRCTATPWARSRASVAGAGWP